MNNIWDERYSQEEYVYGQEPNLFFKEKLSELKPGKLLLPADGEGRNSVFARKQGWDVLAFDSSEVAREKALKLAEKNNLSINYIISSHQEFIAEKGSFSAIALIYAHIHKSEREIIHRKYIDFLASGGTFILEAYSKEQIENDNGGPKQLDSLYSIEELINDFRNLSELTIWEEVLNLNEGEKHKGISHVIRLIGKK